jgi:hypothetical protein
MKISLNFECALLRCGFMDFNTQKSVFYTQSANSVILHTQECNFDTYVWEYDTRECDFYTLESDSYTKSVISTGSNVISTRTIVISTRTSVI